MNTDEFSPAFSLDFDPIAHVPVDPAKVGKICYPDGTDWGCTFTEEQIEDMLDKPEVVTMMERAESMAWSVLAGLTAFQISTCPITVRPCVARCGTAGTYQDAVERAGASALGVGQVAGFNPHIGASGIWVNSCGHDSGDCSCTSLCEAILPGPVGGIEEVRVDGDILPNTAYRVDNGNRLVRLDGQCWPACQDFSSFDPNEGFYVTYHRGVAPNTMTKYAAGVLAGEFLKACLGSDCRLPDGVIGVARQGITFQIAGGMFTNGVTGIREVDAIIGIYNPGHLRSAPVVHSPDSRTARVTTWS